MADEGVMRKVESCVCGMRGLSDLIARQSGNALIRIPILLNSGLFWL